MQVDSFAIHGKLASFILHQLFYEYSDKCATNSSYDLTTEFYTTLAKLNSITILGLKLKAGNFGEKP